MASERRPTSPVPFERSGGVAVDPAPVGGDRAGPPSGNGTPGGDGHGGGRRPTGPPANLSPPWSAARLVAMAGTVVAAVVVVAALRRVGIEPDRLREGWHDLLNLLERMVPIELPSPSRIAGPVLDTLMMAVAGTAIAIALSLPLSFLAASNTTPHPWARTVARGIILGARAVPDLVYALVFVRVLGVGVLPGVLAIAVYSTGMIGKLFADAIEEVDEGVRHAVLAVGASRVQSIVTGVMPQVMPSFVSSSLYRLDLNVAASAVLGFVGAGGIGFELYNTLRTLQYRRGLGVALVVILLVVAVERLSAIVRASIVGHEEDEDWRKAILGRVLPRRFASSRPAPEAAPAPTEGVPRRLSPPWTVARARRTAGAALAGTLVVLSFFALGAGPFTVLGAIPPLIGEIGRFLPPDFASVRDELPPAMLDTLSIGVAATFLATVMSLPIAFLAARNVAPHPIVYRVARYFVVFMRALPPLVLALIFVSAFGLGAFSGAVALALGSIGLTAKLMADAIEHIRPGPGEAVRSVGATRLQESVAAVTPQVIPSFVATVLFTLDCAIRSSLIVGVVGAGGVGFIIYQSVHTLQFRTTSAVLLTVLATVLLVERASDAIRRRIL